MYFISVISVPHIKVNWLSLKLSNIKFLNPTFSIYKKFENDPLKRAPEHRNTYLCFVEMTEAFEGVWLHEKLRLDK